MKNTIKLLFLGLFLFGITATRAQISTSTGGAANVLPNAPTTNTNVGIGTTTPTEKLVVRGNGARIKIETSSDPTNYFAYLESKWDSNNSFNVVVQGTQMFGSKNIGMGTPDAYISNYYGIAFATQTSTVENANVRMYLNQGGNLGIGTTTPKEKVQVTGGNISIRTDTNGTWGSLRLGSTNDSYLDTWAGLESDNEVIGTNVANLKFYTSYGSRSEKMRVTASGNVGIGTTTPYTKLEVVGVISSGGGSSASNLGMEFGGLLDPSALPSQIRGVIGALNSGTGVLAGSIGYQPRTGVNASHIFYNEQAETVRITSTGNVGIGSKNPDEKLTVKGKIHAEEIKVDLAVPADYVFQKYYTGKSELKSDYAMPTLAEIESFTKKNHHLPNVPSAQEIQQKGVSLGEMSNVLLQKVEELTLYAIEQNKVIEELKAQVATLLVKKQ